MMTVKQNAYHTSFKAAFLAKYSREPDIWDAYSYEAGKIISESISKVGNDPSAIKTYLLSTTFDSMTGSLKFDSDGEVDRKFGILQVRNGQFADVEW
jgi:branched-chain amino acid transport system substrate-binding protein